MPPQECLGVRSTASAERFQLSDRLASTNDDELLAPVLDGVEHVGEVASRVGRADLRHKVRLSDLPARSAVQLASASGATAHAVDRRAERVYPSSAFAQVNLRPIEGARLLDET